MDHKISVIVPVYNAEKYLNQCVDSLLNQTYQNIEVILIDDGSVDSSPEICDRYAAADCRVKVVHQKNQRIGAARNRGIEEATGAYLTFIDSDDYIEPDTYLHCITLMEKYDADLVQWDLTFLPEEGCRDIIENREQQPYCEVTLDRDGMLQKFFEWKNMDPRFNHVWTATHCVWTKLCKAELFHGVRFPVAKEYEDEMILHKIVYNSSVSVLTNCRFSNYRLRATSTVHTMNLKGKLDKIDAFFDRYELIKTMENRSLLEGTVHDTLAAILNCYLAAHEATEIEVMNSLRDKVSKLVDESSYVMSGIDCITARTLLLLPKLFVPVFRYYRKISR